MQHETQPSATTGRKVQNPKPICLIDSTIVLSDLHREKLSERFELAVYQSDNPDLDLLHEAEAFLLHSRFLPERLKELTRCRYIGIRAHNLDYIDLASARGMGKEVRGIPPVGQVAVAEHTFALIFGLAKHLFLSHKNVLNGKWRESIPLNFELHDKYLGIIGYGAIGQKVAEIGRAIGMKVIVSESRQTADSLPLDDLLSLADVVSIHIPYRPQNHLFMDRRKIDAMKDGAFLINTARGGLLDYDALEAALRSGKLSGAGMDVFDKEPPTVPNSLFELPNVICTPHLAYYSRETLHEMNRHLVENVLGYFGKT